MWNYSRVVETTGLVAIVLTLLFLGYELKRANDIAEADAAATVAAAVNEFNIIVGDDAELSDIFFNGLSDYDSLDANEKRRFRLLIAYVFTNQEAIWKFYQKGMISEADAEYYVTDVCPLLTAQPQIRELWLQSYGNGRPRGFAEFVTRWCPDLDSKSRPSSD